ncbi:hypothetical protein, partial [Aquibium carbonis]|uniref:hypothetical protein n=1 Tax=Aquibium carbonis TaxID=2495581 RepID=UPI001AEC77A7
MLDIPHHHRQRNQPLPRISPAFHPRPEAPTPQWRLVFGGTRMDEGGLDDRTLRRIIALLVS